MTAKGPRQARNGLGEPIHATSYEPTYVRERTITGPSVKHYSSFARQFCSGPKQS